MQTISESEALRALVAELRRSGQRIGFVPTMGNLHAGHHSLLGLARERADVVIASVFVNPTQFGPNEDFERYPRTPEADAAGLAAQGCDVLFLPTVVDLYPYGAERSVTIRVPDLCDVLEGAIRPGHFDGVATVVAKLFNLVQPDVAVFGQKDYQQLLVIRRMVRDLGFPIEIASAPIVRERNGLAMSSRNQYLSAEQRERAGVIQVTLLRMAEGVAAAWQSVAQIEAEAHERLAQAGMAVDYAVIRDADDLGPVDNVKRDGGVALIAARFGSTRLIDNRLLDSNAVEHV
ncbi:MAG: pantoate--beta-alanine ligase [Dokdonella sp.]